MNFDKIRKELRDHGYIDERNVVCHSYANHSDSISFGPILKVTHHLQEGLPKYMLISLCKDQIIISKAKLFGGFKEYFCTIDLKNLEFVAKKESMITSFEFKVFTEDGNQRSFVINTSASEDTYYAEKLVKLIQEWKKEHSEN